jgi:predicted signal transduction protein with EAL and GGDEF domain
VPEAGAKLADGILEALREPFLLNGQTIQLGGSCGIAQSAVCGGRIETMLKGADLALYQAKFGGRNRHVIYEPRMLLEQRERCALEASLRQAIETDALEVHYQPMICAASQKVQAFEALVRWTHPERGVIPPDRFIPLAEETGLIVNLGNWVLREACAEAARWPSDIGVSVNLSPLQFRDPELVPSIIRILTETGLDPTRLELEITESALLTAGEQNVEILRAVRDLGARVSLDDFGTGYSSMNYLQQFDFDKIKIDRRFIRELKTKKNAVAVIKAIVDLGAGVGMEITAEGVETEQELEAVVSQGCTEVQGYYFSQPVSAEEARAYMVRSANAAD